MSNYDPAGEKVIKNGGNKPIHDGVKSEGEKYPKPNGEGKGKTE